MTKPLTTLITGASAGFGEATARTLAAELKTNVHTAVCNAGDRAAVERLFAGLPPASRDIDVLVNNAGLALGMATAQEASLDDWGRMVAPKSKASCTSLAWPRSPRSPASSSPSFWQKLPDAP